MPNRPEGRIPCRPLMYSSVSLAVNYELILDYERGLLYIKDGEGKVRCITDEIIIEVIRQLSENPDEFNLGHVIVVQYGPDTIPLDQFVVNLRDLLDELKKMLGYRSEEIPNTDEDTKEEHPTVTKTFLDTIETLLNNIKMLYENDQKLYKNEVALNEKKTIMSRVDVHVPIDGWSEITANKQYSLEITVNNITEKDLAYVYLIKSEEYNQMNTEISQYGNVYKVETADNKIKIYMRKKPTSTFTIRLVIPRTVHEGITENPQLVEPARYQ